MEKKTKATTRTRATAPATKKSTPRAAAPRKRATRSTAVAAPVAIHPVSAFAPSHDQIAAFAYSLFEQSGHQHGRALEHWLEAEARLGQGLKL